VTAENPADAAAIPPRGTDDWVRRVGVTGIAFAVLTFVGFAMLSDVPTAASSDAEFAEFYTGDNTWPLLAASFYIIPFAGIAFIWFLAALRHRAIRLEGTEDALFATVQLVSGVLFIAMTFASAATGAATAAAMRLSDTRFESVASTRQLTAVSQTFLTVFAVRSAAVFVLAGTARARRTGMFPRWFTAPSLVIGLVLLLATTFYRPVVLLFPLWVATVGLFVWRRLPLRTQTAS
jgi:hypothetical protein